MDKRKIEFYANLITKNGFIYSEIAQINTNFTLKEFQVFKHNVHALTDCQIVWNARNSITCRFIPEENFWEKIKEIISIMMDITKETAICVGCNNNIWKKSMNKIGCPGCIIHGTDLATSFNRLMDETLGIGEKIL